MSISLCHNQPRSHQVTYPMATCQQERGWQRSTQAIQWGSRIAVHFGRLIWSLVMLLRVSVYASIWKWSSTERERERERYIYIYMIIYAHHPPIYAHHPPMTRSLGFLSLSLGIGVQVWTCECCMCHSKKTPERQVSYRIDSDSDRNRNVLTLYWKYCHLMLSFFWKTLVAIGFLVCLVMGPEVSWAPKIGYGDSPRFFLKPKFGFARLMFLYIVVKSTCS